jgi:CRP/FNR family transcriptional regulator, cyclic AMP receptor protein
MEGRLKLISIVVADNHPAFLRGVADVLRSNSDMKVVGECGDRATALNAIRKCAPTVAVLDISMSNPNGIDVLASIAADRLATKAIFLTAAASDRQLLGAIARGAQGIVLKETALSDLARCIRAVAADRQWFPSTLVDAAIERETGRQAVTQKLTQSLTSREGQIITLVAEALSNKEVGRRLKLSEGTVKIHLHSIYKKLGVANRTALAALAIAHRDELALSVSKTGTVHDKPAILSRLPEQLSAQLFAGAEPRHLKPGEALFVAGDAGDGCYRLEQGLLKVMITSSQGDERILAILRPGAIVGELAIIDGRPRSASVVAVRDCELNFISHEHFEKCTQQYPDIYRYLVNVLALRLRETVETMAAASFLTVKARLARALLEVAEYLGENAGAGRILIRHKFSQSDLAAMAGLSREVVSRVLNDWKQRKLVTRSSGYYRLNDIATLKRHSGLPAHVAKSQNIPFPSE